jgi:hypothetical protein
MMRQSLAVLLVLSALCAPAQQPTQQAAPPAGSNWQHVQALPIGASISVKARTGHQNCILKTVDADSLTCIHGKDFLFQRTDVRSITIPRHGRSTLIAAGIGIGAGVAIGAATYNPCTAAEQKTFLGCLQIFSRGDLALVGGVVGGVIAAPIGYFTNFAKSTVYKAP